MPKLLLSGAAAAAIFAIAPATAQPAAPPAPQVHVFHAERDRAHTRAEVVTRVRDMFAKLDSNRDGYVTREEAQAGHKAMARDKHAKFAKRLAERAKPDRGAMFDRLDTNRDGAISRQEFMSAQPRVHERRMIVMRRGEGGAGPHPMRMHGMGMRGKLFETADANRDGRVTLQEMTAAALQRFDTADANRDGTLTREERMQMRQQRRAQRQPA